MSLPALYSRGAGLQICFWTNSSWLQENKLISSTSSPYIFKRSYLYLYLFVPTLYLTWQSKAAKERCLLGSPQLPRKGVYLADVIFPWHIKNFNIILVILAKKIILGSQLPSRSFFFGSLYMATFAWRSANKNNYFHSNPIFLGGFRPSR